MAPIRPILRDHGVTEQQWRVLRVLDNEGNSDPTGLAEAALLFPPSVARILKDLVDRRLIARKTDPNDKRRAVVTLAPKGQTLIRNVERTTVLIYHRYRAQFGKERVDELISELKLFINTIGEGNIGGE